MEWALYQDELVTEMDKAIASYQVQLSRISIGQANPQILNSIKIIYYESATPINELAAISVPEPRQLLVKPFDRTFGKQIAKAINASSLDLNAQDEGDKVRINIPELTYERRTELVKQMKHQNEVAKIAIRHVRQQTNKLIKADHELSEDQEQDYFLKVQNMTDKYIGKVATIATLKEKDLINI